MAQHAITAVHYEGGKIDLVAIHPVVEQEFGSTNFSLAAARRVGVGECIGLLAAGEEVCAVRRTEDHQAWEVVGDIKLLPGGRGITCVDVADRPTDALRSLPTWD